MLKPIHFTRQEWENLSIHQLHSLAMIRLSEEIDYSQPDYRLNLILRLRENRN